MKRTVCLLGILGLALMIICLPLDKGEAAPVVVKAVSCWPITHVGNDYYKEFIKRVNEKCKGEVEIQLLGGPEVVSVFDQLKGAGTGVVDMIHGDPNYWSGVVAEGTIPQLAKNNYELKAFRESGIVPILNKAYPEKGKVTFLGVTWIGMPFYIMTKKPVSKLDDIKGLKLRSMGGMTDLFLGEFGASLVKISSAETYEGLQRGIVDGALRNTVSLVEFKEYEVMKGIISPASYGSYGAVFIGERKWNTIPENVRKKIDEVMIQTERDSFDFYHKLDGERLKEVQEKHGMTVLPLSASEIARVNETKAGAAIKDWIFKRAPEYGPAIYEKLLPFIK